MRPSSSRNDRLLEDVWRVLGMRDDDGGDLLGDLRKQHQATLAKLDALSLKVAALEARTPR